LRNEFCDTLVKRAANPDFVFLTGDLGYMALEPLQKAAGERFINAGVAEQNMVSVAAGLASQGLRPWAYSIAPFIYARPLEQVRNDVCLHDLPVTLVGNGGGYAYGVMGGTHHAIEDYGILLSLQHMRVFVPAFGADVEPAVDRILQLGHPAYLRLGRDEKSKEADPGAYAPWRKVLSGGGPAMVVVGPIAGALMKDFMGLESSKRPNLWVLAELPLEETAVPGQFLKDIETSGHLAVVEEHVAHGSAGEMIARFLLLAGKAPRKFSHFCAQGYLSGYYGSQGFHRKECGLTSENILKALSAR
jgi:transketolase